MAMGLCSYPHVLVAIPWLYMAELLAEALFLLGLERGLIIPDGQLFTSILG